MGVFYSLLLFPMAEEAMLSKKVRELVGAAEN